jgi:hypothetical protein
MVGMGGTRGEGPAVPDSFFNAISSNRDKLRWLWENAR